MIERSQSKADSRGMKERNESFQALVQEVTDLTSMVKDIVELRDDQEDSIGACSVTHRERGRGEIEIMMVLSYYYYRSLFV